MVALRAHAWCYILNAEVSAAPPETSTRAGRRVLVGSKMPVVFIVSDEWDLRGAVRAELREAGVDALGLETTEDLARTIAGGIAPALVVLDGAQLHNAEMRQALQNLTSRVPLLVVDSRLNPGPPLPGAQVILRPVQVKEIVARVLAMLSSAAP